MSKPRTASPALNPKHARNYGLPWVALCLALALHVTDEALTDFLSVYNPTVESIRRRLAFLPLPTFTFRAWLAGLILAVVLLMALSPFAIRRTRWMVPVAYGFAVLMLANGLLHIAGSIYLGRWMPGVYSSPVLLICSMYLLRGIWNRDGAEGHV
jgi:hypothetical protein